jgi:hypothetical protein
MDTEISKEATIRLNIREISRRLNERHLNNNHKRRITNDDTSPGCCTKSAQQVDEVKG